MVLEKECLLKMGKKFYLEEEQRAESALLLQPEANNKLSFGFLTLKSKDFDDLKHSGKTFKTPHFLFVFKYKDDEDFPKIGFTLSRKVGKAVFRNKLKRRLRESIYKLLKSSEFKRSFDLNVVVLNRKDLKALDYLKIDNEVSYFFSHRIFRD